MMEEEEEEVGGGRGRGRGIPKPETPITAAVPGNRRPATTGNDMEGASGIGALLMMGSLRLFFHS